MNDKKISLATQPQLILWPNLIVLTAYFLLTILMTWPAALHLSKAIPGDGFDGWQNYWNLWWVREAILVLGQQPYFTDYLYPPAGTNLYFHTLNIFNGLWTLPLQLNFGLAIAYNSVVFFSFVLAGYGGYLLSLYTLTQLQLRNNGAEESTLPLGGVGGGPTFRGARLAAFVGGLVFTMSPFHLAHLLGHMQVFSMVWPPFYVLWLLRTLRPWQTTPLAYQWRDIALTCLFLILATLVDWYHTLYLVIFTGLVLLWTLWQQFKQRRTSLSLFYKQPSPALFLRPIFIVAAIGLGFALILAPLLIPMIGEASARSDLETGLAQNITLSADLLAFFLPSEMHPLWGEWAAGLADNFTTTTSERLIFAGFTPLVLALYIVIRGWRWPIVKFWALIALFFFLLALGPFLHVAGQMVKIGDWPLPMPYLLLYYTIPFIDLTRSLSRYDLMVMLALGILGAIALVSITNVRSQGSGIRSQEPRFTFYTLRITHYALSIMHLWLPLVTILLICFEFLPLPYPISKIDTPPFYFDLANQAEKYTIAELPMNWDRPTPLLYQTVHQKRLLTAYTSRNNPRELAWRIPVFQHWRNLGPDIIDQPLAEIAPTIFFDFNLRYIVLDYWQMPPGPERAGTEQWVAAALPGVAPIYDDGRLKVYQSPPKTETEPYLSLGNGWAERQQNESGRVSRAFSAMTQPELFLHHPQNRPLTLEITATSRNGTKKAHPVTLLANGEVVVTFEVRPNWSTQTISLPAFDGELVKLTFAVEGGSGEVVINKISLHESVQ